jgi:amidophosphoribosyltransferase
MDGLYRAMGQGRHDRANPSFCDACFSGAYPTRLTDHEELEQRDQLLPAANYG